MLHAQGRLRCEVDMLENGCVKDYQKNAEHQKRVCDILPLWVYLSDILR